MAGAIAIAFVLAIAAYYPFCVMWPFAVDPEWRILSGDAYTYSYPTRIYLREAFERGHGLLWNDFQNSGQPFLGMIGVALFYPTTLLYLFVDIDLAVYLEVAINFAICGVGMYFLCRELRLAPLASVAGAAALQLGGIGTGLAGWTSLIFGAFAWIPITLLFCERLLRSPTLPASLGLGTALGVQILAGFPQTSQFTIQLIALRVLWEFASLRRLPTRAHIGTFALGVAVVPIALAAVQILPTAEVFAESLRNRSLTMSEARVNPLAWETYQRAVSQRMVGGGNLFNVAGIALAGFAFAATRRRVLFFYALAGALYFALAFSPDLLEAYRQLPTSRTFRSPTRFIWITAVAFAVLVAYGLHALVTTELGSRASRWASLAVAAGGLALFRWGLTPTFEKWEIALAVALAGCGASLVASRWRVLAAAVACALLLTDLVVHSRSSGSVFLPNGAPFYWARETFESVRSRTGMQYRIFQDSTNPDGRPGPDFLGLMRKSASVFRLPSVNDYEPLTSDRYARLFTRMTRGRPIRSNNDFQYRGGKWKVNKSLFDLLATRFVIVDATAERRIRHIKNRLKRMKSGRNIRVFENRTALPRAFFVGRARVVQDPEALLNILATRSHRPRSEALLEASPADGFLGLEVVTTGSAEIISSRGEELVIDVDASHDGFLSVTDQYQSSWTATVNGVATPIERSNYAFRLVRVPAGTSRVVFRYQPRGFWAGATISLATLSALIGYAAYRRLTRRQRIAPEAAPL